MSKGSEAGTGGSLGAGQVVCSPGGEGRRREKRLDPVEQGRCRRGTQLSPVLDDPAVSMDSKPSIHQVCKHRVSKETEASSIPDIHHSSCPSGLAGPALEGDALCL